MNELGNFCVVLAWGLALFGIFAGAKAGRSGSRAWFQSARNATILCFFCTALSIAALGQLFLSSDFRNNYVWSFSNREMDSIYKISAIWGGMDGSMLLWCFMLSISSAIVAFNAPKYRSMSMPWVLSILNSSLLFFLTVVVFLTNPFRYLQSALIPTDGNGLNPLLQNPYMAVHPPTLYVGFTTFAIPFAFCMGALLSGNLSNEWIRMTRRWTLIAWGFLTAGIVLGGHWAYLELGWGGFWAWDPVENASFLPWLTGTAFVHSVMVQERKNMLRFWNVWLISITYGLTVFGTFLTRSGVVQSVHAFAETDIGWVFLVYLSLIFLLTLWLSIYRRKELRSERKIESYLSREAFFLLNNLLFLSICFATFWGVMFPVFSEAITGTKQTVSIPFFNAVNVPLFLLLIFLMGIGPLIAWRKATFKSLLDTFLKPFIFGCAIAGVLMWGGVPGFYPILSYGLCAFVFMTIMGEFHRGVRAQRLSANLSLTNSAVTLMSRHRIRYGGYLVHIGVLVATVAITAAMAHKTEQEFSLAQGESYQVGRFELTLTALRESNNKNYTALIADLAIKSRASGEIIGSLSPEIRRYLAKDEPTTEVALRSTLREDLYLVIAGLDDSGQRAALKVFINPLQVWLWIGTLIILLGTIIVLIPRGQVMLTSDSVEAKESVRA